MLEDEKMLGNIPESFTLAQVLRLEFVEQANRELEAREDLRPKLKRRQQWVQKYGF